MHEFIVRRLSTDDAQSFRDIRLEGLQNCPEAFGADYEDERNQTAQWFADRLKTSTVLGGFNESGELCGVIGVARGRGAKTRHNASIWGMYVRGSSRGTGMARHLLDVAIATAFAHCQTVRLTVVESNHAARNLYSKAGFREWATDVAAIKIGDVFHDEIMMRIDKPQSPPAT
jgi:RimJ/RimL family protein N-acetyltransferase